MHGGAVRQKIVYKLGIKTNKLVNIYTDRRILMYRVHMPRSV